MKCLTLILIGLLSFSVSFFSSSCLANGGAHNNKMMNFDRGSDLAQERRKPPRTGVIDEMVEQFITLGAIADLVNLVINIDTRMATTCLRVIPFSSLAVNRLVVELENKGKKGEEDLHQVVSELCSSSGGHNENGKQ
ncbi:hypothetical protein LDJ79_22320 [Vibrio tritonius]|uniref:Uncharacterized protein n=1 Tax=Vibrio tritonius TaxID=1435069 RepID=A0ABS7YT45_9VIBR|nr:hypothetical protein [Vibrio tritonius]MCA2018865.1 hypothetical protein [Vibrio tritonius]